ncbi:MAG: peptidoglycan-binding domain-containing protein [Kofleriaceae bacterium]
MATFEHNSAQFGYLDLDDLSGVQKALAKLGVDPGKLDGIDGPNTQKAVRAFQAHALIDVDGKVGKNTRQALVTELAAKSGDAKPTTT